MGGGAVECGQLVMIMGRHVEPSAMYLSHMT